MTQPVGDPPQSALIAQRLGKGYGFTQEVVEPSKFVEWQECRAQVHPQIDALFKGVPTLGEVCQAAVELALGHLGDRLQERKRDLRADDGCALQQVLFLGWQPINACRQDRLHGGGHLDTQGRPGYPIGPWGSDQDLRFHQHSDAFFQEESVALGSLAQALLDGIEGGVVVQ
jgi:hypothetical protein